MRPTCACSRPRCAQPPIKRLLNFVWLHSSVLTGRGQLETAQGDVEPLAPPGDARAAGPRATPHVALLQPGEAIIVPRCACFNAASRTQQLNIDAVSIADMRMRAPQRLVALRGRHVTVAHRAGQLLLRRL